MTLYQQFRYTSPLPWQIAIDNDGAKGFSGCFCLIALPTIYNDLTVQPRLNGQVCILTLPFQCTDFTVQRIVGRKNKSIAPPEKHGLILKVSLLHAARHMPCKAPKS